MHRNLIRAAFYLFPISSLICASTAPGQIPPKELNATGFAGRWSTTLGGIWLEQNGEQVIGTLIWDPFALRRHKHASQEIEVTGKSAGRELKFKMATSRGESPPVEIKDASGTIQLWKDGEAFSGSITGKGRKKRAWSGYRLAPKVAPPVPGKITRGQSKSWLNYHLRVPTGFSKSKRYPAIAFLHGSNRSSSSYVKTIAIRWPEIARRYILVGFDGECLSPDAKDGQWLHFFTYNRFEGPEDGPFAGRQQSPALVADALDELKTQLPITHWFAGGHSQGGCVAYKLLSYYPEKVRGVLPMSCEVPIVCPFTEKSRQVAVAIIHSTKLVSGGLFGERFPGGADGFHDAVDSDILATRLFTGKFAAHMFPRLPVDKAVAWLEEITSTDPKELLDFAKRQMDNGHYRDASGALLGAEALTDGKVKSQTAALWAEIDKAAARDAAKFTKAIRAKRNGKWVESFYSFRQHFAFAPAAKEAMSSYASLRAEHTEELHKRSEDTGNAVYMDLVYIRGKIASRKRLKQVAEKFPAASFAYRWKSWLK